MTSYEYGLLVNACRLLRNSRGLRWTPPCDLTEVTSYEAALTHSNATVREAAVLVRNVLEVAKEIIALEARLKLQSDPHLWKDLQDLKATHKTTLAKLRRT